MMGNLRSLARGLKSSKKLKFLLVGMLVILSVYIYSNGREEIGRSTTARNSRSVKKRYSSSGASSKKVEPFIPKLPLEFDADYNNDNNDNDNEEVEADEHSPIADEWKDIFPAFPSPEFKTCSAWLEASDELRTRGRDFEKDPILVEGGGGPNVLDKCAIPCVFAGGNSQPDASFGGGGGGSGAESSDRHTYSVIRTMESATNYPSMEVSNAHKAGYEIVMTTRLDSEVPVGYFSWVEYPFMRGVREKKAKLANAVAFISNCGAINFRLKAIEKMQELGISVDSYGSCLHNADTTDSKVEVLSRYKFYLAFENSNELDYVTEKYLQALVAGTVPVVIGAPNILDYEPQANSILHIKSLEDVPAIVQKMKYLLANETAYNEMLRWKQTGPSEKFLGLVDMAVVHSSCRLCLWVGTRIFLKQVKKQFPAVEAIPTPINLDHISSSNSKISVPTQWNTINNRPCRCSSDRGRSFHIYFRERGKFEFISVVLEVPKSTFNSLTSTSNTRLSSKSRNISLFNALANTLIKKLISLNYEPIWTRERPDFLNGQMEKKKPNNNNDNEKKDNNDDNVNRQYHLYRIYPVDSNQRSALYGDSFFANDGQLLDYLAQNPCPYLEIILI